MDSAQVSYMLRCENNELWHVEESVLLGIRKVVVLCRLNRIEIGQAATGREEAISGLVPADDASHLLQSAMLDQIVDWRHLRKKPIANKIIFVEERRDYLFLAS